MQKLIIGVSGNRGSFSEEAAVYYCRKNKIGDYQMEYLISVDNVLKSLKNNKINKGLFPLENSNGGIVVESIYAMAKYIFNIEKIFEIDIQQNLLVLPATNPGAVKTITSHHQALKQCRMYLKRKWNDIELKEYCDTASAAKDLSEGKLPACTAVVAPKICAKLYGLDILEEAVQDLKFNYTSFIVAVK